ncbi:MAG: efflux RND transporter periplasmic adaptor subunit [Burkholderiaceae bacterium]
MRLTSRGFLFLAALAAVALAVFFGLRQRLAAQAPPPKAPLQAVKTALAEQKSIPITLHANGSVTAINSVDVRPQIQNVVRAVHVREGQDVQPGQLLFTLDARGDDSNVARARAQVASQRAELADAEQVLRRNQELLDKKFVSQAVVDSARNKVDSLRSALLANQAALEASSIAAGYNQVRAGIGGRIGAISVHVGSLAQPGGAPLLTIYQMDPIAVSFAVPERELAQIRATYPDGDAPVTVELPDGSELEGKLMFIDNSVDSQSGTILMKSRFANPDRKLWPGTFVNVRMTSRTLARAVAIPAQGVITGPTEQFVYAVQSDDTVRPQKIEVQVVVDGVAAVTGLEPGTRVVIEGAKNLRPGARVREAAPAPAARQVDGTL